MYCSNRIEGPGEEYRYEIDKEDYETAFLTTSEYLVTLLIVVLNLVLLHVQQRWLLVGTLFSLFSMFRSKYRLSQ